MKKICVEQLIISEIFEIFLKYDKREMTITIRTVKKEDITRSITHGLLS